MYITFAQPAPTCLTDSVSAGGMPWSRFKEYATDKEDKVDLQLPLKIGLMMDSAQFKSPYSVYKYMYRKCFSILRGVWCLADSRNWWFLPTKIMFCFEIFSASSDLYFLSWKQPTLQNRWWKGGRRKAHDCCWTDELAAFPTMQMYALSSFLVE